MKIIGIIGTHGKTSILYILEFLFSECNINIGVIGDCGVRINKNKLDEKHQNVQKTIREMEDNNVQFLLIELHENDQINNIVFDCILFSDFNEMEYTKDRELFFRQSISKSKNIIINADSDLSLSIIKGISSLYVITYGLNYKSTITASTIAVIQDRMQYNYCLQRGIVSDKGTEVMVQEMPVELNLLGYQNIYNTLASITTALLYDLNIEKVITALRNITPIPNRLELIKNHEYKMLIDMAKDSHSFKMLFEALQYLFYKKLYIGITIENIESLLKSTTLEDFIDDFSLIQGACVSIIGKPKEKGLDSTNREILVEALIKNKLSFDHFIDPQLYFNKYLSKLSKDDLFVWIGSNDIVERYIVER